MAKVSVAQGRVEQGDYPVTDGMVLGRSSECDVTLPGALCSRRHARIIRQGDAYCIEDLGSANGTLVNGRPVARVELRHGDQLTIGDYQVTFLVDEGATPLPQGMLSDGATATVVDVVGLDEQLGAVPGEDGTPAERLREHLAAARKVSERVCGALDIASLTEAVLGELLAVYPQAESAHTVMYGLGENGADLNRSAVRDSRLTGDRGISRTLVAIATDGRKAVLAADAQSDSRLQMAQSIVEQQIRSLICCPLAVGPDVLGAIQVDTSSAQQSFTTDDLRLLVTIAGQVAVGAQNARLHQEMIARQRLAAIGEAVSGVAHCMKNVINGLNGGAYILDLGLKRNDDGKVAKGWDMVKRNAGFMGDLARDMLTYCRKAPPSREAAAPAELLQETMLLVSESATAKGVTVSLSAAEGIPDVLLDGLNVKRAILNLLSNAVEACAAGSTVSLTAALEDGGAVLAIRVADDGPGIPPDVLRRLFEPFFTTKGSKGTGLGLALVDKVVREHGGTVEVRSEVGKGTAFHVKLPVVPARRARSKPEVPGESHTTQPQKQEHGMAECCTRKVLVVDDEPDAVEFVKIVLEEAGYEVVSAFDGEAGMAVAREEAPDLIILDVQMPKKDGFATFAEMAQDAELGEIPVVMLTGISEKSGMPFSGQDMGEYFGKEPAAYVEKPVDPETLQQTVKKLLSD
jgi:two-component system NtrC family sensor kinase